MRPPALAGFFKAVPKGGDTLGGVFLPEGTAVGSNMMGLARCERAFGRDVNVFRPERFLECNDAVRAEMERTVELAFGLGRFMCAGKLVAITEINKALFEV